MPVMASNADSRAWFLRSTFPVDFPSHEALSLGNEAFEKFVASEVRGSRSRNDDDADAKTLVSEEEDMIIIGTSEAASTTQEVQDGVKNISISDVAGDETIPTPDMTNKMFTDNHDLANISTRSALTDLFSEQADDEPATRLRTLLAAAWREDSLLTLKIIFNSRSIHLGKSSRIAFYEAAGFLALEHPATLIGNLAWLARPVIEKKVRKNDVGVDGEEAVLVRADDLGEDIADDDVAKFDVRNGVSHGYWKDLLNLLVLSARGKLNAIACPNEVLLTPKMSKRKRPTRDVGSKDDQNDATGGEAEATRDNVKLDKSRFHASTIHAFEQDPVHRSLHLAVARLFAQQLKTDLENLRGTDSKAKRKISLAGKWAPSTDRFHDRHTFIVSSIAEMLHPVDEFAAIPEAKGSREIYLRHAREAYRKDMVGLRAHLDVVERKVSAKTFSEIKYNRVPSLAMRFYAPLFAAKDTERFANYLQSVSQGTTSISGATLLPSTLVRDVLSPPADYRIKATSALKNKIDELARQVVDGQWKTLVQRIKDSGVMSNSMAVCDVSGSMTYPTFSDKSVPLDSAIGLSLLLAEVTEDPFGGMFITFSRDPHFVQIDLKKSFHEKIMEMSRAAWGANTDFVAVFSRILALATEKGIKQEGMIKRLFVFSDMQFDEAHAGESELSTSYQRIQKLYAEAGYDMPELVFWNLAAQGSQPKPVVNEDTGTCLVSGYSPGMMKVFMDGGGFGGDEEETITVEETGAEGGDWEQVVKKKEAMSALAVVKRATGHKAYEMLRVLD